MQQAEWQGTMPATKAVWHDIMTAALDTSVTICQDQLPG